MVGAFVLFVRGEIVGEREGKAGQNAGHAPPRPSSDP
jgi:hypothetical protein